MYRFHGSLLCKHAGSRREVNTSLGLLVASGICTISRRFFGLIIIDCLLLVLRGNMNIPLWVSQGICTEKNPSASLRVYYDFNYYIFTVGKVSQIPSRSSCNISY